MEKLFEEKLNSLFAARQKKIDEAEAARKAEQATVDASVAAFVKLIKEVIRPAMQEMSDFVTEKGYSSEILERSDGKHSPSIRWTVFPEKGNSEIYGYPGYSFRCDGTSGKISLDRSTISPGRGGMSGSDGTVAQVDITKEFVQQKIASILFEVFR